MKPPQNKHQERELDLEAKALRRVTTKATLSVDYESYEHLLDNSDMSEEQKREFIQALWSIIFGFASLGFGINPVQHGQKNACGKPEKRTRKTSPASKNTLVFNSLNHRKGRPIRSVADQSGGSHADQ